MVIEKNPSTPQGTCPISHNASFRTEIYTFLSVLNGVLWDMEQVYWGLRLVYTFTSKKAFCVKTVPLKYLTPANLPYLIAEAEHSRYSNHPRAHTVILGRLTTRKIFPPPLATRQARSYRANRATQTLLFSKSFDLAEVSHGNKICSKPALTWKLTLVLAFPAHCISNWKLNGISRTNISKVTLNVANESPLPFRCATDPLLGQEVGEKCAVEHVNVVRKLPSGWSPYGENSPITQTIPEPTLLSWEGWPLEKNSLPTPGHTANPGLITLIRPLRPHCSRILWCHPLIPRCATNAKFA